MQKKGLVLSIGVLVLLAGAAIFLAGRNFKSSVSPMNLDRPPRGGGFFAKTFWV